MGHGYVDVPIPPACGVPPVTRRGLDAAVETATAAIRGVGDYWASAIVDARTPLDIAVDGMRWWQIMTERRPPRWATRHRIVRRTALTRLRDFSPASPSGRRADARPPAAGRARLVHRRLQRRPEPDADDPRGRPRPAVLDGLDRRDAGDEGRDDLRLPRRDRRLASTRSAAPSTSSATARAAGWRRSTPRCTPRTSTRSRSRARRSTSTPATRSSTRASRPCPTRTCASTRTWSRSATAS